MILEIFQSVGNVDERRDELKRWSICCSQAGSASFRTRSGKPSGPEAWLEKCEKASWSSDGVMSLKWKEGNSASIVERGGH